MTESPPDDDSIIANIEGFAGLQSPEPAEDEVLEELPRIPFASFSGMMNSVRQYLDQEGLAASVVSWHSIMNEASRHHQASSRPPKYPSDSIYPLQSLQLLPYF